MATSYISLKINFKNEDKNLTVVVQVNKLELHKLTQILKTVLIG